MGHLGKCTSPQELGGRWPSGLATDIRVTPSRAAFDWWRLRRSSWRGIGPKRRSCACTSASPATTSTSVAARVWAPNVASVSHRLQVPDQGLARPDGPCRQRSVMEWVMPSTATMPLVTTNGPSRSPRYTAGSAGVLWGPPERGSEQTGLAVDGSHAAFAGGVCFAGVPRLIAEEQYGTPDLGHDNLSPVPVPPGTVTNGGVPLRTGPRLRR